MFSEQPIQSKVHFIVNFLWRSRYFAQIQRSSTLFNLQKYFKQLILAAGNYNLIKRLDFNSHSKQIESAHDGRRGNFPANQKLALTDQAVITCTLTSDSHSYCSDTCTWANNAAWINNSFQNLVTIATDKSAASTHLPTILFQAEINEPLKQNWNSFQLQIPTQRRNANSNIPIPYWEPTKDRKFSTNEGQSHRWPLCIMELMNSHLNFTAKIILSGGVSCPHEWNINSYIIYYIYLRKGNMMHTCKININ